MTKKQLDETINKMLRKTLVKEEVSEIVKTNLSRELFQMSKSLKLWSTSLDVIELDDFPTMINELESFTTKLKKYQEKWR